LLPLADATNKVQSNSGTLLDIHEQFEHVRTSLQSLVPVSGELCVTGDSFDMARTYAITILDERRTLNTRTDLLTLCVILSFDNTSSTAFTPLELNQARIRLFDYAPALMHAHVSSFKAVSTLDIMSRLRADYGCNP
jgi:hypothetical protein